MFSWGAALWLGCGAACTARSGGDTAPADGAAAGGAAGGGSDAGAPDAPDGAPDGPAPDGAAGDGAAAPDPCPAWCAAVTAAGCPADATTPCTDDCTVEQELAGACREPWARYRACAALGPASAWACDFDGFAAPGDALCPAERAAWEACP